ncbi:MAG TPA: NAD(+)/NADH kinase [Ignavibacteriaceae bacterium]|nr:NAD(+)/NADH kinase [Ignavibacteriaceae bacterium]
MTVGIIANINKKNVYEVISAFTSKLKQNKIKFYLSNALLVKKNLVDKGINKTSFLPDDLLCRKSDIIVSIGGDGTMLATAFHAHYYDKPVFGVNFGKLGFLAEGNINQLDYFIEELRNKRIKIVERMVIKAECLGRKMEKLYAINDIVIEKGAWPKMIELSIGVGKELVTTFAADGLIVATPIGSTGYSISVGGPIVSPKTDVITLSPISPHSLTIRPLVLPSTEEITINADSLYKEVQVNCDGQRVFAFPPPLKIKISKSSRPVKLVHTSMTNYFETLRNKLLWGIDLRKRSNLKP